MANVIVRNPDADGSSEEEVTVPCVFSLRGNTLLVYLDEVNEKRVKVIFRTGSVGEIEKKLLLENGDHLEMLGISELSTDQRNEFLRREFLDNAQPGIQGIPNMADCIIQPHARRFHFRKRFVQDLLNANDLRTLIVSCDSGTFRFTKNEFVDEFRGILETVSWERDGLYHWPNTPQRAFNYRIK